MVSFSRPCVCFSTAAITFAVGFTIFGILWWGAEDAALDPKLWGKVEVAQTDLNKSHDSQVIEAIQEYWAAWTGQDVQRLSSLFVDDEFVMISQQTGRRITSNISQAFQVWQEEWSAYEGNDDVLALQLRIHKLDISSEESTNNATLVTYWLEANGGIRWSFDDSAFVTQVFGSDGKILYHADCWNLDHDPTVQVQQPVTTTFSFDFVYPVQDLERAASFYEPLLGPAEVETASQRIFDMGGHRFILDTSDLRGYAQIDQDLPSGYAIFYVEDIEASLNTLQKGDGFDSKTLTAIIRDDRVDPYFLVSDPGGNVFVVKEVVLDSNSTTASNSTFQVVQDDFPASVSVHVLRSIQMMETWLTADVDDFAVFLDDGNATSWFDETQGQGRLDGVLQTSPSILESVVKDTWETFDRNPQSGLSIDMTLSDFTEQTISTYHVVTFKRTMVGTGNHPFRQEAWMTQIYKSNGGEGRLVLSTTIRSKPFGTLAQSLDYTGFPIPSDLGRCNRFYVEVMGLGDPYTDTDWYGYWSSDAVFGIYRSWPRSDNIPRADQTNGYVSFWVDSAQDTYAYLRQEGSLSRFPIISAINEKAGIDEQPGYTQVVTTDSEGNLLLFTEYS